MPINYIFNGYYRSGTTGIWNILRSCNREYVVFYEPLHPQLEKILSDYKAGRKIDKVHGKDLWAEYFEHGDAFLRTRNNLHTFSKHTFPENNEQLFKYLDLFHNLAKPVILQPNRLHFHLGAVAERYGCKVFHVIRNPVDVYNSLIQNFYNRRRITLMKLASYVKNRHTPKSNVLKIKHNIEFAYNKYKMPSYWGDKSNRIEILRRPFVTLVLSWIVSNFIALQQCNALGGNNVFSYEKLTSEPSSIQGLIQNTTDLTFDINMIHIRHLRTDIYRNSETLEAVEILSMKNEYDEICNQIL